MSSSGGSKMSLIGMFTEFLVTKELDFELNKKKMRC